MWAKAVVPLGTLPCSKQYYTASIAHHMRLDAHLRELVGVGRSAPGGIVGDEEDLFLLRVQLGGRSGRAACQDCRQAWQQHSESSWLPELSRGRSESCSASFPRACASVCNQQCCRVPADSHSSEAAQ